MAQNPPVMRHRDWRFLLRDFVSAHTFMAAVPNNVLQFGLAPVAGVARWLCMEQPGLLERESLTLLIPGASDVECADDGRWFTFLPWMLGCPGLKLEVHLVGPELSAPLWLAVAANKSREDNSTPAAQVMQRFPAAKLFHGTLGQWSSSSAAVPVDACILFSPGFTESYGSWFAPGELAEYIASVPLGLFSYSSIDFLEDQAVLRMLGFKFDVREQGPSPWVLGDEEQLDAIGGFGGYLWTLINVRVPEEIAFNSPELEEFIELEQLLHGESAQWGPDAAIRRLVTPLAVGDETTSDEIYLMPNDFAVLKSSGLVGRIDDVGFMQVMPPIMIPMEVMAARRPGSNEIELVQWSLRSFRDYVLPWLTDEGDSPESLVRGLGVEDMEQALGEFASSITGKDIDGHNLMRQIRISGGVHGPTHPYWEALLNSLGWNPVNYVEAPTRLEPAFWVAGAKYAKEGLPVVCEAYAYVPDDTEDELAIEAMQALEMMYPEGVLLGFKSMPFKEIEGRKYTFGGLLYWYGNWHPFAMTTDMTSVDAVIEQVQSGFSFENVNPLYADDSTKLAVPFNRMCFGLDPNETCPMMGLKQATGWVTLMPS